MVSTKIESWRDKTQPQFGHAMLEYFPFDPGYVNLNHGSYGSLPLPVMEACKVMDSEAESNPDRWIRFTYSPRLTDVRQRIAALIGAKAEECVLVPNASHGISTVLRNIEWQKDDIIVAFNTTYGSVLSTVQYISDTSPNPSVVNQFRDHLKRLPRKGGQKVVAILDSISSVPALLLPWKEMVQVCKEEGVMSLIDAAHSIGQETNLELNKADPDFWVSYSFKFRNQHLIKSTLPTSTGYVSPSNRKGSNFVDQFEWIATIDFVPYLSVATALDFRQWLGGEEKINAYCRQTAIEGSKRLAQILGTTVLDPSGEMTLNMVNVKLPLPLSLEPQAVVIPKMKEKLILGRNMYAYILFFEGIGWWARCSAQVWTEVGDFEKLGNALVEVCAEVLQEVRAEALKSKL
ncbi:pyridoxal phosphate-dependent transferase [Mycena galopus ATCC 62051]|nr:pyridoxal phosphate-dependent transferase [Mycena galopus ATCC 62051]